MSGDFDTFLTVLPEWEYQLLCNLSLRSDNFTTLQEFNKDSATLYAVSDGSAPIFIGTFGWVMQTDIGIHLADNNDPAPGYRTTSFFAEAYRILSILFFLLRAFQYTMLPHPPKIIICTDSQSVLTRVEDMMTYAGNFSSATIQTDWDVLQAIMTALKQFNNKSKLKYVRGHQDKNKSYHQLDLETHMNVDADRRAGKYMYQQDENPSKVQLIKECGVLVHLKQGTINSRYKRHIRRLGCAKAMETYICKKQGWDTQFRLVDWLIHGRAIWKTYDMKHFVVNFVHDWLPVRELVSIHVIQYPASCPSCDCVVETSTHMLRCPARRSRRKKLVVDIKFFLLFPNRSIY